MGISLVRVGSCSSPYLLVLDSAFGRGVAACVAGQAAGIDWFTRRIFCNASHRDSERMFLRGGDGEVCGSCDNAKSSASLHRRVVVADVDDSTVGKVHDMQWYGELACIRDM